MIKKTVFGVAGVAVVMRSMVGAGNVWGYMESIINTISEIIIAF